MQSFAVSANRHYAVKFPFRPQFVPIPDPLQDLAEDAQTANSLANRVSSFGGAGRIDDSAAPPALDAESLAVDADQVKIALIVRRHHSHSSKCRSAVKVGVKVTGSTQEHAEMADTPVAQSSVTVPSSHPTLVG